MAGTGAGGRQDAGAGLTVPAWPSGSAARDRLTPACRPDEPAVRPGAGVPAACGHRGTDGAHAILDPLPRLPLMGPVARPADARPEELTATTSWAAAGGPPGALPPPAEHPAAASMTAPSSAPAGRDRARACAVLMALS